MKKNFLAFFIIIWQVHLSSQKIIHTDPYDIKKTSVSVGMFVRPLQGIGPQLRISHYIDDRTMLFFNCYFGILGKDIQSEYKGISKEGLYRPSESPKPFRNFELCGDFHIIDKSKDKMVNVALKSEITGSNTRTITYTKVPSNVRRILAVTSGIQYMMKNEELYDFNDKKRPYYIYDINSKKNVKVNDYTMVGGSYTTLNPANRIFTDATYTNLLLGLKFKAITLTGVDIPPYGKNFSDIHLETYFNLIIPINHTFTKNVYKDIDIHTPVYSIIDKNPAKGFMVGVLYRRNYRPMWSFGSEFGVLPSIRPRYGQGFFFNFSVGLNLNFGKLHFINQSIKT